MSFRSTLKATVALAPLITQQLRHMEREVLAQIHQAELAAEGTHHLPQETV